MPTAKERLEMTGGNNSMVFYEHPLSQHICSTCILHKLLNCMDASQDVLEHTSVVSPCQVEGIESSCQIYHRLQHGA